VDKFLAERGLQLSPHKTKMYTLKKPNTQLDFLGYTFKYQKRWSSKRNILFQKGYIGGIALYPNKEKVRNFISKIKTIFKKSTNLTSVELIMKLNPIIRGWANYYNLENSSHYRSVIRRALYLLCWKWMKNKHPTLGKRLLARMYFLQQTETPKSLNDLNPDSPNVNLTETNADKKGINIYSKLLNNTWNFRGLSSNKKRFSKQDSTKVVYLLDPTNAAKIISTSKNVIPVSLRHIHAFSDDVDKLKRFKLKLAIASSSRTPSLKEKLFIIQNGLCHICQREIDSDYLMYNTIHIHHINPIKYGGNNFALNNLALTHIWCHRKHKH